MFRFKIILSFFWSKLKFTRNTISVAHLPEHIKQDLGLHEENR